MKISKQMINWLQFPREIVELVLAPYMECPPGEWDYVMQHHWRGRSVHVDWRMATNGHLVGFTVLDNPKGMPKVTTVEEAKNADKSPRFQFKATVKNVGRRAETKARQPKEWLKVEGVVKPGEVGATEHGPGVLSIWDKGKVIFGTQKPYFHEYFIKSSIGKEFPSDDWTRIIVRRVGVPVLTPEKKPLEKKEVMWRVLIPSEQRPYTIGSRAIKRKWKPPKENRTPFPVEWTKKNFAEDYAKWEEYMKGKSEEKKTCRTCAGFETCPNPETCAQPDRPGCENWVSGELIKSFESLPFADYKNFADCVKKNQDKGNPKAYCAAIARKTGELKSAIKFTLHFHSWMGQFVVRGVPKREWYLRVDDQGEGKVRSFFFEEDPLYFQPVSGEDEGRVSRKWLSFDGKLAPRTEYNPNKKISSYMKIIDRGSVDYKTESEDGIEIITLGFKGKKLKGKWRLVQEEKRASTYTFDKLSTELADLKFALQVHWIPLKSGAKFPDDFGKHWDVRISNGVEFNLYQNPLETEGEIKARRKTCKEIMEWINIRGEHKFMKVGPLGTFVDAVDTGKIEIYEMTPDFMSMKFFGEKLTGYFIYKRKPDGEEIFMKSQLPKAETMRGGDPAKGDYLKPFEVEQKQGWEYFWVHVYSPEDFTRCVEDPTEYIPELKNKPKEVLEISICLYPRPGTIHGARFAAAKFSNEWTQEQAFDWIKKNKFHEWEGELIRKEHKSDQDLGASILKILEHELDKRVKTPEEKVLDQELKEKKLELIEKWLQANKEDST